mgnify:CR=1 FL=1
MLGAWCGRGSSPRMRGAPTYEHRADGTRGIIPAHAGSTNPRCTAAPWTRDHPRACGEHSATRRANSTGLGSSPRMRGARSTPPPNKNGGRIIPAHAGSTCQHPCAYGQSGDHPRACGEHTILVRSSGFEAGSSPRMRGARRAFISSSSLLGIIPAHAGSTADHLPKACECDGSSPRMRGAQCV